MMRLTRLSALLLGSVMLSLPYTAGAAIYKWTDEHGQVHFSDQPPTKKSTTKLNVPAPKPGTSANQNTRLQQQLKALDSLSKQREEREKKREEKLAEKKKKKEGCADLKARIKHSESVNTYYRYTDEGEVQYLTDEEGDALRAEMKRQYQKNCS